MPLPHRLALLLPLLLALASCGDSPSSGGSADRAGASSPPSGLSREAQAKLEEVMTKRLKEGNLGSLPSAMGPLKPADVETYLKVNPEVRKVAGDITELTKVLQAHGLTAPQWAVLQGRIVGAAMGLKHGQLPPALQGDAAVVEPYKDRVLQSIEGK